MKHTRVPAALTMRALARDSVYITVVIGPAGQSVLYLDDGGVIEAAYPSLTHVAACRGGDVFSVTRGDAAVMLDDATERGDGDPNGTDHSPAERQAARRAAAAIRSALEKSLNTAPCYQHARPCSVCCGKGWTTERRNAALGYPAGDYVVSCACRSKVTQ